MMSVVCAHTHTHTFATMFLEKKLCQVIALCCRVRWRSAHGPKFEGKLRKLNYEIKQHSAAHTHINLLRNTEAAAPAPAPTNQPSDRTSQACLKVFHFLSSSLLLFSFIAYTFSNLSDFLFFRRSILGYVFISTMFTKFFFILFPNELFFLPSSSTTEVLGRVLFFFLVNERVLVSNHYYCRLL